MRMEALWPGLSDLIVSRLSAEDEVAAVGAGIHERVIINLARFDRRMQSRIVERKPSVSRG